MEKQNGKEIFEGWNFKIVLESDEYKENSDYWQEQCNIFYNMIREELPSGSVQPLSSKSVEGDRTDLITIFSTILVTGLATRATYKVIDKIIDIAKIWQENRAKVKITLKYKGGSTVEFSNLSISEAKKTMKEHQKKLEIL